MRPRCRPRALSPRAPPHIPGPAPSGSLRVLPRPSSPAAAAASGDSPEAAEADEGSAAAALGAVRRCGRLGLLRAPCTALMRRPRWHLKPAGRRPPGDRGVAGLPPLAVEVVGLRALGGRPWRRPGGEAMAPPGGPYCTSWWSAFITRRAARWGRGSNPPPAVRAVARSWCPLPSARLLAALSAPCPSELHTCSSHSQHLKPIPHTPFLLPLKLCFEPRRSSVSVCWSW